MRGEDDSEQIRAIDNAKTNANLSGAHSLFQCPSQRIAYTTLIRSTNLKPHLNVVFRNAQARAEYLPTLTSCLDERSMTSSKHAFNKVHLRLC